MTQRSSARSPVPLTLLLLTLLAACGNPSGRGGGAGGGGGETPPEAPVLGIHAFALAAERPVNMAGERGAAVDLGLVRRDAAGARYADGIAAPRVVLGGGEGLELPLLSTPEAGFFTLLSRQDPRLALEPGLELRFRFDAVGNEGARESYEAVVRVPEQRPRITVQPALAFLPMEPVELELRDLADGAHVQVFRIGAEGAQRTWSSLTFSGPGDLSGLQRSLRDASRRIFEVPGAAFPRGGEYRIDVVSYELSTVQRRGYLTRNHGADSVYGAGVTSSVIVEVLD